MRSSGLRPGDALKTDPAGRRWYRRCLLRCAERAATQAGLQGRCGWVTHVMGPEEGLVGWSPWRHGKPNCHFW